MQRSGDLWGMSLVVIALASQGRSSSSSHLCRGSLSLLVKDMNGPGKIGS